MTFSPDRSSFDSSIHFAPQREVPCAIVAEQQLLGSIMVNNAALGAALGKVSLSPNDFYEPIHRKMFQIMLDLRAAGKMIHPVSVVNFLSKTEKVDGMTIPEYLALLCGETVMIVMAAEHAETIFKAARARDVIDTCEEGKEKAYTKWAELKFVDEIASIKGRLALTVADCEKQNERNPTFSEMVDTTLDQTAEAMAGREPIGLDPGIPEMMQLTGPWQDGQLIVIGGDVKVGKSAAAWQCMFNIAEKHPFGGISGEMPVAQIMMREKARRTGISAKRQKQGRVSSVEIDELVKAGADIKRLKHIDIVSKQLTLDEIDERINRLQGEFGIKCFIVDHILKLAWSGKMEDADDFKKANKATSTLKNIAMKRNIPIVALTHINKNANDASWGKTYRDKLMAAKRRRPTYKSMLGNIDKDVDNMILVHQAYPAVAGMEPEENTADHELWEQVLSEVKGKAQFILALSRENEFPRSKDIDWIGESTSFGPPFKQAMSRKELF